MKLFVFLPQQKSYNMIDKRTLEFILTDQQEELQERADEMLCRRKEAVQVDLKSRQAQVVIGVRRSGKSTMCYQALQGAGVNYAYADFDDERMVKLEADQLNDVLESKPLAKNIFLYFGSKNPAPVQVFFEPAKRT